MPVELRLPYPVSANRYWRMVIRQGRAYMTVSSDAEEYRREVARIAMAAGIRVPIEGRVAISIYIHPQEPKNTKRRMKKHGAKWDDTVQCIDVDNGLKVMIDAMKGIVYGDDRWVREIHAFRCAPAAEAFVDVSVWQL